MDVPKKTLNRKLLAFSEEIESKWTGPFCFIQAADTQYGMIDSFVKEIEEEKVTWTTEIENTKLALAAANRMVPRPRFFVVCGDLVDAMPGTMHRKAQVQDWNEAFRDLDNEIPLVCVCGNHDLGNTPTAETINEYVTEFGSDDYFTFWCGGVYNIVLNSQLFEDSSQVQSIADEHLKWIDEQLAYAKAKKAQHVLIFQHIPLFLEEPDEPKQYFNLDNPLRQTLLEKFHYGGVKAIFCGHYHRNAGGKFREMELIVTTGIGAALGENEPSGLRVVKVYENRLEHQYYPLTDIPTVAGLEKS